MKGSIIYFCKIKSYKQEEHFLSIIDTRSQRLLEFTLHFQQKGNYRNTNARPSASMSVRFRGKRDFLRRQFFLSLQIRLTYEHLFYKYFVRRSVGQDTKGRNVKILKMKFSSPLIKIDQLFFLYTFLSYMSIFSINNLYVGLSVSLQKAEM